jgi:Family of unknown function (DUF5681)
MSTGTKGDYEVGYGKPPRGAGFKRGRSGNPRGWLPGAKNQTTLLNDALNEPVTITENGRRRKITKREAVIKQLVNKSASSDARSLNAARPDGEPRGAGAVFRHPAPGRRPGRRGGPGAAQVEARRCHPGSDRNREMTPIAYRHPEAPPADIPFVFPWAVSPRTSSVGKAGTHRAATPEFSRVAMPCCDIIV